MNRDTEIALLEEVIELSGKRSAYLGDTTGQVPVHIYTDPNRFNAERAAIFQNTPAMVAHSSQLPEANSFLRVAHGGAAVLLTRDADGLVRAFHNVCRHRGTRLVDEPCGKKKRFSCPYHAWTWDNQGKLVGIPHEKQGFPDLDRDSLGLVPLTCREQYGFIWVASAAWDGNIDAYLEGLGADFAWFDAASLTVAAQDVQMRHCNWKILVEGGIESYHFKVAHKKTIAPFFKDNLSTYQLFGPHMRSVLARKTVDDLNNQTREHWALRDHANVLYTIFPSNSLLVQSDHIVWIQMLPVAVDQTQVIIATLAPKDGRTEHWQKNQHITVTTLNEDFTIGDSIQSGLNSGANTHLNFGRFESALKEFNTLVDKRLAASGFVGTLAV